MVLDRTKDQVTLRPLPDRGHLNQKFVPNNPSCESGPLRAVHLSRYKWLGGWSRRGHLLSPQVDRPRSTFQRSQKSGCPPWTCLTSPALDLFDQRGRSRGGPFDIRTTLTAVFFFFLPAWAENALAVSATLTLPYRGTSLIRNNAPLGPYSRTMPMALWWS